MRRTVLIVATLVAAGLLYFAIQNYSVKTNKTKDRHSPVVKMAGAGCAPMSDTDLSTVSARGLSDGLSDLLKTAILSNPELTLDSDKESIIALLDRVDVLEADVEIEGLHFEENKGTITIEGITLHELRPAGTSCNKSFGSISIGGINYDAKMDLEDQTD